MIKKIKEILIMALMMSISFSVSAVGPTSLSDYKIILQGLEDGNAAKESLSFYVAAQEAALMEVTVKSIEEAYKEIPKFKKGKGKKVTNRRITISMNYIDNEPNLSENEKIAVRDAVEAYYDKILAVLKTRKNKEMTTSQRKDRLKDLRNNKESYIKLVLNYPDGPEDKLTQLYGEATKEEATFNTDIGRFAYEPTKEALEASWSGIDVYATQYTNQSGVNATCSSCDMP
jgi:hypothetical protein